MTTINDCDISGRPWAKLSELKLGDWIELDAGFTCHGPGKVQIVLGKDNDLVFLCRSGEHTIDGQSDDSEHCVGIYGPVEAPNG